MIQSSKECIKELVKFSIKVECLPILFSKLIGILIIVFSSTLKVPQIREMQSNPASSKDLSEFSNYLDVMLCVNAALYSFHYSYPFTSYGENVLIGLQNIIIMYLFFRQKNFSLFRAFYILATLGYIFICVQDKYISENVWNYIGNSGTPLIVISRSSTILYCLQNKSSGPLKAFTFILGVLGCVARIFTTISETGDLVLIVQTAMSFLLDLIVLVLICVYGNKSKVEGTKKTD